MASEDELTPATLSSARLPAVGAPEDEVESAVEVLGVDSMG
jgi:hypothetical protein